MSADPAHLYLDAPAVLVTPRDDVEREVTLSPPGSKSLANRYIPLLALLPGTRALHNVPRGAQDVERMLEAVQMLGAKVEPDKPETLLITGVGGRWTPSTDGPVALDAGGSGTCIRFLAALALLSPVPITLTGDETLCARPIGQLTDALESIGARIDFQPGRRGKPPFTVHPPAHLPPDTVTLTFGELASSQFISGLMMLGAFLPGGLEFTFKTPPPSVPYIEMTHRILSSVCAATPPKWPGAERICVTQADRRPRNLNERVEPDASAATYLWASAAVGVTTVIVSGLNMRDSLQGDTGFANVFEKMGAAVVREQFSTSVTAAKHLRGIKTDLSDMPDTAMTLAAVATMAKGTTTITGLKTLRVKETDRVAALETELSKLGPIVTVTETTDDIAMVIDPSRRVKLDQPPVFDTYRDHRMAMSLALLGLREPGAIINNPGCVAKTYPGFWTDFSRLANVQPIDSGSLSHSDGSSQPAGGLG